MLNPRLLTKAALIFMVALALYFFSRSPGLDEWDSVQFAMGVRSFDMWKHHPHPPGYPLFILFGWLADRLFGVGPILSLHFASAAGGAAFVAIWFLIISSQFSERLGWWVSSCLALTPAVWMTATKVLTDTPATAFLSAEILAAIYYRQRQNLSRLLTLSLLGAIAVGTRPQLVLIALIILAVALKRGPARTWLIGLGSFIAANLAWLIPTSYFQTQLNPAVPVWRVFFDLSYSQWIWRLNKPSAYIGAGDWSPRYLAARFVYHFLGWFGLGFGFLESLPVLLVGIAIAASGILTYLLTDRQPADGRFWRFHASWSLIYILMIFVCLPAAPRYYIIIFPLLLVALLRGFLQRQPPWNIAALTVPAFLVWSVMPLATANHRDAAPPLELVEYLERLYPQTMRGRVVLLLRSAKRHAEWYAPEFRNIEKIPPTSDLPEVTHDAAAVFTDDPKLALPKGWYQLPLVEFKRSLVIYQKHHVMTLFLVERPGHL